ncbi:MAG TPA: bifunctional response regulator/alkaline phosphatase family protein [Prolixibacteraceae bacterium]|nr:bifunctional response regulator/alkaline phosphatase family protein [Prolixibacteraceae bacterium]HPS13329.1 bifunctional response regulator/alkaline phosphatase family protein [Prolixibacteraceae bacterium]
MQTKKTKILWVDDEIDLLKPHIIFLENKGYEVLTSTNGSDAIDMVREQSFDIIFLDENMPGYSGLETLSKIKEINHLVPVIMITKNEEETIMDEAIGSKMADYLIKPVNPNQILLSIKKNVDQKELVTRQTTSAYQMAFSKLGMQINDSFTFNDWEEVYRKLVFWEMELSSSYDKAMDEVLQMQKSEANVSFARFIKKNYLKWLESENSQHPMMSPDLFRKRIFPALDEGKKVFVLLIDNLRYDQWRALSPIFSEYFTIAKDEMFFSILPTATMYARNSIFSGLMPADIKKIYPELWDDDDNEDGGKNNFEEELLRKQLLRNGRKEKLYFEKITNARPGRKSTDNINQILQSDLAVVVLNFVDMISHARTEMDMIKELASDEAAYRSLTISWFKHSGLTDLLEELRKNQFELFLTTDHGTIKVNNPIKVIGEKNTNTNLRYKLGRNLNYNPREVFEIRKPGEARLPALNVSTSFIFAMNQDFFAYPNNFNYYANYYKNTFQHGGISLEEMMIPIIRMQPK